MAKLGRDSLRTFVAAGRVALFGVILAPTVLVGCGTGAVSDTPAAGGMVAKGGSSGGTAGAGTGGMTSTGGASSTGGIRSATGGGGATNTGGGLGTGGGVGTGGTSGTGGTMSTGGASGTGGDAGTGGSMSLPVWTAGNVPGTCRSGIPARGQAVDTSHAATKVGVGTAESCSFAALASAVAQGGIITFDCGREPTTIRVTSTLMLPNNKDTVIDGGRRITLDGGQQVQILRFESPDFRANDKGLTLQHIALINGKATPTQAIPAAPAPCAQGWVDGQGGALFIRDGGLTIIDSVFRNNTAAPLGPDTGGGAIYALGSKAGVTIVGSSFLNNSASNAGAVGGLFAELAIYDSVFMDNRALGRDANTADETMCTAVKGGQTGSGGNGAAIYSDGDSVNVTLCGDAVLDNAAGINAFGGGLFFTSNNFKGVLTIADTMMLGNTGRSWTYVMAGTVMNVGSAVGTNALSITLVNSQLQGLP